MHTSSVLFRREQLIDLRFVRRWQGNGRRYRHVVSPCLPGVIPVPGVSIGDISRRPRRYANFLLLEHARLLLDRGEHSRAREVLLQQCTLAWDPKRYLKRLLRTSLLGQWGFQLARQMRAGE